MKRGGSRPLYAFLKEVKLGILPVVFLLFTMLYSCSNDVSGVSKKDVPAVVANFSSKVLYNTQIKDCKEILSRHVYFKPFINVETGYKPTAKQVEYICTSLASKPMKFEDLKEVQVQVGEAGQDKLVAVVMMIRKNGQVGVQQSIILKRVDKDRYVILW